MTSKSKTNLKKKKIVIAHAETFDWTEEDRQFGEEVISQLVGGLLDLGYSNVFVKKITDPISDALAEFDPQETVIFNWAECWGDDGTDYWTVPKKFEELGFAYTGSNPECLRLTVDKLKTKETMLANKISTPKSMICFDGDVSEWKVFPAMVKPAKEHCSTGIDRGAVVDTPEALKQRVDYILTEYGPYGVLVEEFIDGNEYNVAVWGNEEPEVLPIGMIDYSAVLDYHDRICGYEAKWLEDSREFINTPVICPAPLTKVLRRRVEDLARTTYKLFGIRDYARIDIREKNGVAYVVDVNTNPDITPSGGLVRSMQRAGYTYGAGVARILSMACERVG